MNVKEALTNTAKHSNASDVFIEIMVLNKIIKACIRDNGQGSPAIHTGMGLMGIEERTKEAGGTLILDGSDGFSIIMIFRYT